MPHTEHNAEHPPQRLDTDPSKFEDFAVQLALEELLGNCASDVPPTGLGVACKEGVCVDVHPTDSCLDPGGDEG